MQVTLNKMEDSSQAYCDDCDEFAVWWTRVDQNPDNEEQFFCQEHAEECEKHCNEVQTPVEWVE